MQTIMYLLTRVFYYILYYYALCFYNGFFFFNNNYRLQFMRITLAFFRIRFATTKLISKIFPVLIVRALYRNIPDSNNP